jgi:lysophospholipase L1-like esterase
MFASRPFTPAPRRQAGSIALRLLRAPLLTVVLLATVAAAPTADKSAAPPVWHALPASGQVEGQGWAATRHPFTRLPAAAETTVRAPVWALAQDSAGLRFRFVTDADTVRARWTLRRERLALPHMPATGASGLDLYVRDGGQWRWVGAGRPQEAKVSERVLVSGLSPARREYLLYLPLYNGVESIEIGLPPGAILEAAPDRYADRKPIVFYGTSITQGGCASRPGMAYPAILGRRLDWPTINLGFSGNGKAEPEIAALLAELDPAVYVLDCLPNLTVEQVGERVEPLIKTLRARHPETPIVLVENLNYPDAALIDSRRTRVVGANASLGKLHAALKKAGDKHLHYVSATFLLGGDGEDTVDGTHPTDLGFMRMAKGMEPFLREALADAGSAVAAEEGFVPLFDGKTLSGWKRHEGMPPLHRHGKWWVEDGIVFGTQDPVGEGGMLWLDRPFTNFILKLQVHLTYPMDSGIFLRVGPTGLSHQMTLDYRPGSDVGAIFIPFLGHTYVYRNPEGARLVRNDDWNDLTIRMEGHPARIRVWLNDRLLTDYQHTEKTAKGLPPSGGIAFQVHPNVPKLTTWVPGATVGFKNVRIKELP